MKFRKSVRVEPSAIGSVVTCVTDGATRVHIHVLIGTSHPYKERK